MIPLPGNEVADDLAKAATSNPVDPEDHIVLTSTEIYSRAKELICRTWVVPPVHTCPLSPQHILQRVGFSCEEAAVLRFMDSWIWSSFTRPYGD
ncbi:RNase H domain-containing protein [Trichonephila clavipes]|nr:RNase H domain-containing protein [Trichonephila clavipes]